MDRRYWLTAALLAMFAASAQILLWLTRAPEPEQIFSGPPRSDYTLSEFELNVLSADGKLVFTIMGPQLARRDDDGSLNVSTPKFVLFDGSGNLWRGNSEAAWVNKDGSIMRLDGYVDMRRDATAQLKQAEIMTADLTTWPKDKRMQTAAITRIQQPGSILRGTGMQADLNAHTLDLLADVHGTFQPNSKK